MSYPLNNAIEEMLEEVCADQGVEGDEVWYDVAKVVLMDWPNQREAKLYAQANGITWPLRF